VAPRQAAATVCVFLKSYRQTPSPEWDGITNVLRVVGCVSIMTSPARAAFDLLIYMQVMEILVSVSESGQCCCPGVENQRFFMAAKAEVVVFQIEA